MGQTKNSQFIAINILFSLFFFPDDIEIFQVKKSNHSKRVAKQLKKETLKEKQGDQPTSPKLKTELKHEISRDLAEEQLKVYGT